MLKEWIFDKLNQITHLITLEHVLEDLVSTVDIRLLEASILLLAEVTVFATAAVAVAVYTAFIPAFIMEKTSKYKYYCSVWGFHVNRHRVIEWNKLLQLEIKVFWWSYYFCALTLCCEV